jgi:ABC-2 type transport system ATP-binding protein
MLIGAAGPGIVVDHLVVVRGGRTVLDDVTVEIPAGQVVGLLGPSGSGKTTLIRSVVGVPVVAGGLVTCGVKRQAHPPCAERSGT